MSKPRFSSPSIGANIPDHPPVKPIDMISRVSHTNKREVKRWISQCGIEEAKRVTCSLARKNYTQETVSRTFDFMVENDLFDD